MGSTGKLFIYLVLLAALGYGITNLFMGNWLEFLFLIMLGILSLLGFMKWSKPAGERLFFFVGLLSLVYLSMVWLINGSLYLMLLFISLLIFLLAFPPRKAKLRDDGEPTISERGSSAVFEPPKKTEKEEERLDLKFERSDPELVAALNKKPSSKESAASLKDSVTKTFSPGLYVASSNGMVYHAPTCNWAKKINEIKRIWLQNKDDARGKGYKAHNCVI